MTKLLIYTIADFADFKTGLPRGVITLAHCTARAQARYDCWLKTLPIRFHSPCGALEDPGVSHAIEDYEMRVERVYIRKDEPEVRFPE